MSSSRDNFFGALSHLGPVPDEALSPEPVDATFGVDDEDGTQHLTEPVALHCGDD